MRCAVESVLESVGRCYHLVTRASIDGTPLLFILRLEGTGLWESTLVWMFVRWELVSIHHPGGMPDHPLSVSSLAKVAASRTAPTELGADFYPPHRLRTLGIKCASYEMC